MNAKSILPILVEITLLLVCLALVLLLAGCNEELETATETPAIPVEVMTMAPDSLSESVVLAGVLRAYRAVDVISEVAGETRTLNCDVGDPVAAGDLLAQLDRQVPRENLKRAEAALMSATAQLELTASNWRRDSALHANGDIAAATIDNSRFAYTTAQAGVLSAQAERALAARHDNKATIKAPFAGIVSRRHCEIGTYISPGIPLFRIVAIDSLRLRLGVSQQNLPRLAVGQQVQIDTESYPGRRFHGRIRSISPEADDLTRTFDVEIVFTNTENRPLRDGMVVRATLMFTERDRVLSVPREAVITFGGNHYLFVVNNAAVSRRTVELGALIDGRYIIESGIDAGEQVVIVGARNLKNGDAVIVEATAREQTS